MNQQLSHPEPSHSETKLEERARRKAAKREAKKTEIAVSTLDALKRLGYANTTMRDIAEHSGMSLGSLTYYFTDKSELITYCVRLYKAEFIGRIESAVSGHTMPDRILDSLAAELARSITDDLSTHRLWYDIRSQAMFDPSFRPVVAEIEDKLKQTLGAALRAAGMKGEKGLPLGYAMLDGVFRLLLQNTSADHQPCDELKRQFRMALEGIVQMTHSS
ncbi:TetR/AcrR family transcriptional regulator [Halomonas binhaiensis]|uniref:TetR/AcrR family transcriptional regulator n=1 Tax=Halomonas binhaiensis TaxID=2562282 RepID=A0A5C1NJ29_9GAMM|nr:TetR/AcrR family transcriptional regulator [Halomonas binhaiensis]QEM81779.1 TetR/AcrR family transcriptional regulator [Halomonas binhaiensis]